MTPHPEAPYESSLSPRRRLSLTPSLLSPPTPAAQRPPPSPAPAARCHRPHLPFLSRPAPTLPGLDSPHPWRRFAGCRRSLAARQPPDGWRRPAHGELHQPAAEQPRASPSPPPQSVPAVQPVASASTPVPTPNPPSAPTRSSPCLAETSCRLQPPLAPAKQRHPVLPSIRQTFVATALDVHLQAGGALEQPLAAPRRS